MPIKQYEPGETFLYSESGRYYLVKCLKRESDSERIRYTLEIVEVLKDTPMDRKLITVGTVLNVSQRTDPSMPSFWHLRDPQAEQKLIVRLRKERDQAGLQLEEFVKKL